MRIRLHEETMNRVRELAQAAHVPAAVIVGELIRNSFNGHVQDVHKGKMEVCVRHLHESRPNPEFRAKLIKGQRGSYGFELTVADADLATVLSQIDRFEEEMLKRYGDEEEKQSLKVRKEVAALYGEEP